MLARGPVSALVSRSRDIGALSAIYAVLGFMLYPVVIRANKPMLLKDCAVYLYRIIPAELGQIGDALTAAFGDGRTALQIAAGARSQDMLESVLNALGRDHVGICRYLLLTQAAVCYDVPGSH